MKKTDRLIILLLISFFQTSHAIASGLVRHNDIEDSTWISDLHKDITDLTNNEWFEKTQLGLCIYDLTTDTVLFEHNPHQRLRPASTLKLLTAITALSELGGAYQFNTQLHYTGQCLTWRHICHRRI